MADLLAQTCIMDLGVDPYCLLYDIVTIDHGPDFGLPKPNPGNDNMGYSA